MNPRAFTLIDLVALAITLATSGAMMLAPGCRLFRARESARQLRDATQQRGIHQSLIIFAQNNQDRYVLPSLVDRRGSTVDVGQAADPLAGDSLDSTRHIFSILIWNGFLPPEMLISTGEVGRIEEYKGFQYDEPEAAEGPDKALALWDPAFRATPEDSGFGVAEGQAPGGVSYAHLPPFAARSRQWRNTFSATEAVLANRGPSYTIDGDAATGSWRLIDGPPAPDGAFDTPAGTGSNTLRTFGARDRWEGNVVLNDNHTEFIQRPDPESLVLGFAEITPSRNRRHADNIFVNEDDKARLPVPDQQTLGGDGERNRNAYLRSYAGGDGANPRIIAVGQDARRAWTIDVFYD